MQHILDQYKTFYPQLKDVKLKQINANYGAKFHGMSRLQHFGQFIEEGKTRRKTVKPECISLDLKLPEAIHVLLHQIAHCISPYCQRKHKGEWIKDEHGRDFYNNFWEIIQHAQIKGMYHRQFNSVNHLIKFDQSV